MQDSEKKEDKKMPVVIEISELENVSGGAATPIQPLTPTLVASRCPPTPPALTTKLTVTGNGPIQGF